MDTPTSDRQELSAQDSPQKSRTIACVDCGGSVSTVAYACPHCGHVYHAQTFAKLESPPKTHPNTMWVKILSIFGIAVGFFMCVTTFRLKGEMTMYTFAGFVLIISSLQSILLSTIIDLLSDIRRRFYKE